MKFKVDENLPVEVSTLLCAAGHDAANVRDEDLCGASDDAIASVCRAEDRILVTLDLDFANILAYEPGSMPGIIVFRYLDHSRPAILERMTDVLDALENESVEHCLWIVEPNRIRIRSSA